MVRAGEEDDDDDRPRRPGRTSLALRSGLAGDRQAMDLAAEELQAAMLTAARSCLRPEVRDSIDPLDIVHEVWSRCLPQLPRLAPKGGRLTPVVVSYLCKSIRHEAFAALRGAARQAGAGRLATDVLRDGPADDGRPGELTRLVQGERQSAMLAAIEELPERDRDLLSLRYFEQLPDESIAEHLGISRSNVRQRARRILQRLRERLPGALFDELDDLDEEQPGAAERLADGSA